MRTDYYDISVSFLYSITDSVNMTTEYSGQREVYPLSNGAYHTVTIPVNTPDIVITCEISRGYMYSQSKIYVLLLIVVYICCGVFCVVHLFMFCVSRSFCCHPIHHKYYHEYHHYCHRDQNC